MAFSFCISGEVVIATDVASNAERVADGVEKWLHVHNAQALRRESCRVEFRGNPISTTIWKSPGLRGIGESAITFGKHPDKVIIHFRLSYRFLDLSAVVPLLLVAGVFAKLSLLLPVPLFIAGTVLHVRLTPRLLRRYFEKELHLAAIRGLADGAAAELAELRSKSQLMGVSSATGCACVLPTTV